jgi:excisionase family DNA binding protein
MAGFEVIIYGRFWVITEEAESQLNTLTSTAGGSQSPLMSVREAAQRLGVSKSTVYRIDRKNGPFRFVTDGRRIFIDLGSLENHMGVAAVGEPEPPLQADGGQTLCPQEPEAEGAELDTRELPSAAPQAAPTNAPASPVTWCGPREPFIPRRGGPFVIFYGFSE